ncbi:hypothetical protein SAMN05444358_104170 [Ruegeria halocynthiae]|uniref:Uncharacterized protein n=1 Tax=Ruegeria halocynthiae TaxID=985054 RepID=A0A1H3AGN6_9RHOB|nr:hypothetical protein [Ruegeria halocynthiae]SDX28862.1 hypothetical protein SAMN05444358_104170 [Ruegeria halocynthiae]
MSLAYDFDIVAIAPDEVDPEHGHTAVTGRPPVRAQFRNIRTADALRGASPKIRRIFQESGFSLDSVGDDRSCDYYRPEDAEDRNLILRRLFANIRNMGVQGEYSGEFDFHHFLAHIRTAKPGNVMQAAPVRPLRPPSSGPAHISRRTVPGRIGFALGLAVILFVLLKLLAAHGAAL